MMLKLGFEYETIEDLLLLFDQKSTLKKNSFSVRYSYCGKIFSSLREIVTSTVFSPSSSRSESYLDFKVSIDCEVEDFPVFAQKLMSSSCPVASNMIMGT